jgi:hypothetical protein
LCYAGQQSAHHILRVFMLRIFPYILCDIPHYILGYVIEAPIMVIEAPIMVIEDTYNGNRRYL